ncbi:MAG: metallophosphoesterase [Ardenticatenales bacterium]
MTTFRAKAHRSSRDTAAAPSLDPSPGGRIEANRLDDGGVRRRERAIFLSDFHLGTIGCKAGPLLDFLRRHDAETLYLVGDIFDNWRPVGAHWSEDHERVVKLLLGRARAGRRIIYVPGNHDEFFLHFLGRYFEELEVLPEAWHRTAGGERLLVTHGANCDLFARRLPWLAHTGGRIESGVRRLGRGMDAMQDSFGMPRWNGIETLVARVNGAIRAHDGFEERLCAMAIDRSADGIVCGHFHQPALYRRDGVLYANCGDWVESCTALIEHLDGQLELVHWMDPAVAGERADAGAAKLGMAT